MGQSINSIMELVMYKKIAMLFSIIMLIILSTCIQRKSSQKYNTEEDNIQSQQLYITEENNNTDILENEPELVLTDELPSIRYVNSKDGLNQRDAPSVTSNRTGTLLHGSRIIVHEKGDDIETIDKITDYWYRCSYGGVPGFFWVFGGYLSTTMPDDTDPILGYWDTDRGRRYSWSFRPDHYIYSGLKESSSGFRGTWTLSGNNLTIITIPTELNPLETESRTLEITVTVINRDMIILDFADGSREVLTRNNNIV